MDKTERLLYCICNTNTLDKGQIYIGKPVSFDYNEQIGEYIASYSIWECENMATLKKGRYQATYKSDKFNPYNISGKVFTPIQDFYKILKEADEMKKTYRKLAMELHPDKNHGSKEAEERFKELNEAYQMLQ